MNRLCSIYALHNPITGKLFYVGATTLPLQKRLYDHMKASTLPTVKALANENMMPVISTLEFVFSRHRSERERFWINEMISKGHQLENTNNVPKQKVA